VLAAAAVGLMLTFSRIHEAFRMENSQRRHAIYNI